jgi:hypothetical protein
MQLTSTAILLHTLGNMLTSIANIRRSYEVSNHWKGLKEMVRLRGGLGNSELNSFMRSKIIWNAKFGLRITLLVPKAQGQPTKSL